MAIFGGDIRAVFHCVAFAFSYCGFYLLRCVTNIANILFDDKSVIRFIGVITIKSASQLLSASSCLSKAVELHRFRPFRKAFFVKFKKASASTDTSFYYLTVNHASVICSDVLTRLSRHS